MKSELIEQIRAIAVDVYQTLGSGFSEDVYDKAMQVGLRIAQIHYQAQKVIELTYKDHCVGEAYPDLVVGTGHDRVVLELKALNGELGEPEAQQLRNYLRVLGISHGLLINFPQPGRAKGKNTKAQPDIRELSL
jgi:GxxExxY protein